MRFSGVIGHRNQLGRRNLTDDQRAIIADAVAEIESKLRLSAAGKQGGRGNKKPLDAVAKGFQLGTRIKVSKRAKVSERKLKKARVVRKKSKALAAQVEAGELTLDQAIKEIRAAEIAQQRAEVAKAGATSRWRRGASWPRSWPRRSGRRRRRTWRRVERNQVEAGNRGRQNWRPLFQTFGNKPRRKPEFRMVRCQLGNTWRRMPSRRIAGGVFPTKRLSEDESASEPLPVFFPTISDIKRVKMLSQRAVTEKLWTAIKPLKTFVIMDFSHVFSILSVTVS